MKAYIKRKVEYVIGQDEDEVAFETLEEAIEYCEKEHIDFLLKS